MRKLIIAAALATAGFTSSVQANPAVAQFCNDYSNLVGAITADLYKNNDIYTLTNQLQAMAYESENPEAAWSLFMKAMDPATQHWGQVRNSSQSSINRLKLDQKNYCMVLDAFGAMN